MKRRSMAPNEFLPNLYNVLQFRLSTNRRFFRRTNQMREKRLVKYLINILQHLIMLIRFYLYLLGASSGVSLWSFATVISAPFGIASGSISLVFLFNNGILF